MHLNPELPGDLAMGLPLDCVPVGMDTWKGPPGFPGCHFAGRWEGRGGRRLLLREKLQFLFQFLCLW